MRIKKEDRGVERGPNEENNVGPAEYGGNAAAVDAEPMPTDDNDDEHGYGDDGDGYGED